MVVAVAVVVVVAHPLFLLLLPVTQNVADALVPLLLSDYYLQYHKTPHQYYKTHGSYKTQ